MLATPDVLPAAPQPHKSSTTTIYVCGDEPRSLVGLIRQADLRCVALSDLGGIDAVDPRTAVVTVVASSVRPETSLAVANEACVARGITWLPIGPADDVAIVGPLVVPGTSACLDCWAPADTLEYRARGYRELEGRHGAPVPSAINEVRHALASLILSRWVTCQDPRLPGRVFTITPGETEIHHAWTARNESCRTC